MEEKHNGWSLAGARCDIRRRFVALNIQNADHGKGFLVSCLHNKRPNFGSSRSGSALATELLQLGIAPARLDFANATHDKNTLISKSNSRFSYLILFVTGRKVSLTSTGCTACVEAMSTETPAVRLHVGKCVDGGKRSS